MLDLKRWQPVTYQLPGEAGELRFEVKRPRAIEAHRFNLASMEMAANGIEVHDAMTAAGITFDEEKPPARAEGEPAAGEEPAEAKPKREPTPAEMVKLLRVQAGSMRDLHIPEDLAERAFRDFVRKVEGPLSIEGEPVTTGPQLYEVADLALVMFVVRQIAALSKLSETEGKASASPSTPG